MLYYCGYIVSRVREQLSDATCKTSSSPLNVKSNGMVKRAIEIVKLLLNKPKKSNGDLNWASFE